MSHVLLVAESKKLIPQAELLATELEKSGHFVTYSPKSHPLRLLSKNFDAVHILTEQMPLSPKEYVFALAAKTLGLDVILSLMDRTNFTKISRVQLRAIDALTTYSLSQYNQLKFFNKSKMIFCGLLQSKKREHAKTKDKYLIIFPVLKSLSELPTKINLTCDDFIVDASLASAEDKKEIKRQWHHWQKNNLQNENGALITQWNTITSLAKDQSLVLVTSHLYLNALQTLDFCLKCLTHQAIWIPNRDQASAFSHFWNKLENRLVLNDDYTFIDQFYHGLSPFAFNINLINESKANEITRLYSRLINEKSTFANSLTDTIS